MIEKLLAKLGLSVQKLYDDLDYWKMIGIASDIYEVKSQRKEYNHLVKRAEKIGLYEAEIVDYALLMLREELKVSFYHRPSFYHLLKLKLSL